MLLETVGLTKHFGGLDAVSDVDIYVRKGEMVGIIGPNGAGKTTLFNLKNTDRSLDLGKKILSAKSPTLSPGWGSAEPFS